MSGQTGRVEPPAPGLTTTSSEDEMAKKHPTTRPLHAQGGPVTAAIRAVREPVAPWFSPVQAADPMVSGFHLGRRHDWEDAGRQELVYLLVEEHDGEWGYSVWRCGGGKPENPADWDFTLRVGGIRCMPADPIDLNATRH